MLLDVIRCTLEIVHGVQDNHVARRQFTGLHHPPAEEIEHSLKYGHLACGRLGRKLPFLINSSDARLVCALESVRPSQGVSSGIVGNPEQRIMDILRRVKDDNLFEIAAGQLQGNLPALQVLQEIFVLDFPGSLDIGGWLLLFRLLYGRPCLEKFRSQFCQKTVSLLLGAAPDHHHEVNVGSAAGNAEVVPDVLRRINMKRGLVLIPHRRGPHILLLPRP